MTYPCFFQYPYYHQSQEWTSHYNPPLDSLFYTHHNNVDDFNSYFLTHILICPLQSFRSMHIFIRPTNLFPLHFRWIDSSPLFHNPIALLFFFLLSVHFIINWLIKEIGSCCLSHTPFTFQSFQSSLQHGYQAKGPCISRFTGLCEFTEPRCSHNTF